MSITSGATFGAEVQAAFRRVDTPNFRKLEMGKIAPLPGFDKLYTEDITLGGLRMPFELEGWTNPVNMGADIKRSTVLKRTQSGRRYDDLVWTKDQMCNFKGAVTLDDTLKMWIKDHGDDRGAANMAASNELVLMLDHLEHFIRMHAIADTRGIYGTIVQGKPGATTLTQSDTTDSTTVQDNTTTFTQGLTAWTGRYEFELELGEDAIKAAFKPGTTWSACVKPTNYGTSSDTSAAVGNVRNFTAADGQSADPDITGHVPMIVMEGNTVTPIPLSSLRGTIKVKFCIYYDATSKVAVAAIIDSVVAGAIGTGDVITPYCGKLAATNTTKTQGANWGGAGLLHWLRPWNIETAAGGISTSLKTAAGTAVSRASGGNFSWWNGRRDDRNNADAISFSLLEGIYMSMLSQNGGDASRIKPFMGHLSWKTLRDSAAANTTGTSAYRVLENVADANKERYTKYGVSTVAFQGIGTDPTILHPTMWWPDNCVGFVDPSDFYVVAPTGGFYQRRSDGGIWYELRNGDGDIQMGEQAFYLRPWQMGMYTGVPNAILDHTKCG